MKKPFWKRTRVYRDLDTGHRVVTLTALVDQRRVWCEEHWNDDGFPERDLQLVHEAYWTNDDPTRHRTMEQALGLDPALPRNGHDRYAPANDLMHGVYPEPLNA